MSHMLSPHGDNFSICTELVNKLVHFSPWTRGFHDGMYQVYLRGLVRTGRDSKTFCTIKDILQIFATTLDPKHKLWLRQEIFKNQPFILSVQINQFWTVYSCNHDLNQDTKYYHHLKSRQFLIWGPMTLANYFGNSQCWQIFSFREWILTCENSGMKLRVKSIFKKCMK